MCRPIESQVLPSALLPLMMTNTTKDLTQQEPSPASHRDLDPLPAVRGVSFQDEMFQRQVHTNLQNLIITATSPKSSSVNALLAKKALRYRKKIAAASERTHMPCMNFSRAMEVPLLSY